MTIIIRGKAAGKTGAGKVATTGGCRQVAGKILQQNKR
ncbi:hypothetical protein SEEN978_10598 [Salmonella enterica subsp. enterica serovar Newport str. CVM 37978]|nr:hypothetical protein SEEN978_10598 [Salmonella enterica subsp. enterica serovar Newport str. CVM 37978]